MKLCPQIDLGRSLRQVFGANAHSTQQIADDCARQSATAEALLQRFCGDHMPLRRELMILADEVGLGKTYVALAVAISMLDAVRRGEAVDGIPPNKPVVLVLTPANDALFNKWMREAESFREDCARNNGDLDWLQIRSPIEGSSKSGNVIDTSLTFLKATRRKPMLLIAKQSMFGSALHDRDLWRRRGLAAVFGHFRTSPEVRRYWCRKGRVFDNFGIPELSELLDLRSSSHLWEDNTSSNLERTFARVLASRPLLTERLSAALTGTDEAALSRHLDDFVRHSLVSDWPDFSLIIVDEIHGLKNAHVQTRRNFEAFATGKVCRMLGLSATPFQLRHDELLSLLQLRKVLSIPKVRLDSLDVAVSKLNSAMSHARDAGEIFRRRWKCLRPVDQGADQQLIADTWAAIMDSEESERQGLAGQIRPPRVSHAIVAALDLEQSNQALRHHLHAFVIRHHHSPGYREYFVGRSAGATINRGSSTFSWSPGMEVRGHEELLQYLMMRAVALVKEERGLPNLGAELTGSYRHLLETAAVWKKLALSNNPLLREYRLILEEMIGKRTAQYDPDSEHHKVQATVQRALNFFKLGQKSLIFCVYTKTAETIRDQIRLAIDGYLGEIRADVFGDASLFDNFRKRFFNRREALFSLIQDHPLLGRLSDGRVGVPGEVALNGSHLREVGELLLKQGERAESDKSDRRLIIAATEQVAVTHWRKSSDGRAWLRKILQGCPELEARIVEPSWLEGREPLSRSERAGRARRTADPEGHDTARDPLEAEESDIGEQEDQAGSPKNNAIDSWERRLSEDAIGGIVQPYFKVGLILGKDVRQPLLVQHHASLLIQFDLNTRAVAGQVFRRILMADEFLLRYLADIEKDNTTRWADYLSDRYNKPLDGHLESLRDRVHAYFETLLRALNNRALLSGYHEGAENRNVVQLVKGDTQNRDRYFLGFNTPYRPDILVSTSVGQEGIDLHRECRHVIHHDLCWNPATLEQRTGRVDRIGSKVERERMAMESGHGPTLEIAVPYLAATYDERMFEELYRRAQLFEVTLGGEMRVEGKVEPDCAANAHKEREQLGIGTDDEDLGEESDATGVVDLPTDMIERLRIDLSIWKANP
jgi:hypothetical protein